MPGHVCRTVALPDPACCLAPSQSMLMRQIGVMALVTATSPSPQVSKRGPIVMIKGAEPAAPTGLVASARPVGRSFSEDGPQGYDRGNDKNRPTKPDRLKSVESIHEYEKGG